MAVDEELHDGVVDEEAEAGRGGKRPGHLDGDVIDEKGVGRLVLIGADFYESADGVGYAVGERIADGRGQERATELLTGVR